MKAKKIKRLALLLCILAFSPLTADKLPLLPLNTTAEFGPFFIPDTSFVNGIYIVYFTRQAQPTSLHFSIAGDLDWARADYTPSKTHSMLFTDMEEGMPYRFEIQGDFQSLEYRSVIQTKPYGNTYEFNYGLGPVENMKTVSTSPHLMFLFSEEENLDLRQWQAALAINPRLYASTVVIPLFNFTADSGIPYHIDDLDYIQYKDARFIIYRNDSLDINRISSLISKDPDVVNTILCNNIKPEVLARILAQYSPYIDFVYGNTAFEHPKYRYTSQPMVNQFVKQVKKKFAVK